MNQGPAQALKQAKYVYCGNREDVDEHRQLIDPAQYITSNLYVTELPGTCGMEKPLGSKHCE